MNDRPDNSFDDLVKDVSSEEKEQLLDKIKQSIIISAPVLPEGKYRDVATLKNDKNKPTAQMNLFAKNEFNNLKFLEKVAVKLKMFFLKKDLYSLIIDYKLESLRDFIEKHGGFVDFEKKTLSAKFADEIYAIYLICLPLAPVFMKIWRDSETLELLLSDLLEAGSISSNKKREITDFISFDQMLEIYSRNSDAGDVRKAILRSVKVHAEALPEARFKEIKDHLLPFYHIQSLVSFPFNEIFTLFGMSPHHTPEGGKNRPVFKTTPVSVLLDYLLKFSYSIYVSSNISFNENTASIILNRYFQSEHLDEKEAQKQVETKMRYLHELEKALIEFQQKVPLIEIIRYFQADPLFKIDVPTPRLDLKQFYSNAARLMALNSFPQVIKEIKISFIDKSIDAIFKGVEPSPLNYYVPFTDTEWVRWHLPMFAHHKSAMLTQNFLRRWYKSQLSPIILLLSSTVLAKSTSLQAKMNELRSSVDYLEEKLRRFDLSLAPETEAGKSLSMLRVSVRENTTQLRLLRSFLTQKDIEALSILNDIISSFGDFYRFTVSKVVNSGVETVKTSLATVYPSIDRNRSLNDVLTETLNDLQNFTMMIKELIEYEKVGNELI